MRTKHHFINLFLCLLVFLTFNSQAAVISDLCPEESLSKELNSDSIKTTILNDFLRPLTLLTGPTEILEESLEAFLPRNLTQEDQYTLRTSGISPPAL